MKTVGNIATILLLVLFYYLSLSISNKNGYERGRREGEVIQKIRCYNAHAPLLKEAKMLSDREEIEIILAEKDYKKRGVI